MERVKMYANRHVATFLALNSTDLHSQNDSSKSPSLCEEGVIQIVSDGKLLQSASFFEQNGKAPLLSLSHPILVTDSSQSIGLKVPKPLSENKVVSVRDIADIVGHTTPVSVIDVAHQEELEGWTFGDLVDYFEDDNRLAMVRKDLEEIPLSTVSSHTSIAGPSFSEITPPRKRERARRKAAVNCLNKTRHRVLNQISFEFSKTKLMDFVCSPQFVRDIDWIDHVWPKKWRRDRGVYPTVQYYCLTSAAGAYTDFHLDFGGTSVWYHLLSGSKEFCLIAPTDENLEIYERWLCRRDQAEVFLPTILKSQSLVVKIRLEQNQTLIIPAGWIHAVYTPEDSLVFGGNFLHGLSIAMQLTVNNLEVRTRVQERFRFPYFVQTQFFAGSFYLNKLRRGDITPREVDDLPLMLDALEQWWNVQPNRLLLLDGDHAYDDDDATEPMIVSAAVYAASQSGCLSVDSFLFALRLELARVAKEGICQNDQHIRAEVKSYTNPVRDETVHHESVIINGIDVHKPSDSVRKPRIRLKVSSCARPAAQSIAGKSTPSSAPFRIKLSSSSRKANPLPPFKRPPPMPREDTASFISEEALSKEDEWLPSGVSCSRDFVGCDSQREGKLPPHGPSGKTKAKTTSRQRLLKRSKS